MDAMELHPESAQTLERFLDDTLEQSVVDEPFVNETARALRIDVDGGVWLKPGAAVAYRGNIRFERLPTLNADSLQHAVMREAAPLVRASGRGRVYCGRHAAHVRTVRLNGESIVLSWHDLVAFEESLTFDATLVGHGVGIAAGGLVVLRLSGHGAFAMATHGRPLTLPVAPGEPVSTDPHATIAWSASLEPALKTDLSWRTAIGHGGQEPVQMFFDGTGFVIVQPYEDASRIPMDPHPIRKLASLLPW
jgi:uncharacterized protein (AIM24 family)